MNPETPNGIEMAACDAERETIALYQDHNLGLLRYGTHLCGNADLAQDAVQEVLLRYFTERRFGRSIDNPEGWLYRVLRNFLLDPLKAPLWRTETAAGIQAELSPREFTCLTLRGKGLNYGEIATAMNIRIGTVGVLLSRVHQKLRRSAGDEDSGVRKAVQSVLGPPPMRITPAEC